jgi:hypothetical protein
MRAEKLEMKALRIAGLVALVVWMAYISWRVEELHNVMQWTCGLVYSDLKRGNAVGQRPAGFPSNYCPPVFLHEGPKPN